MTTQVISHSKNAARGRTTMGTRNARVHATIDPGCTGRSRYVSQQTLDRMADAEYSARTDGGWRTKVCRTCYTRRSANGTCNCN